MIRDPPVQLCLVFHFRAALTHIEEDQIRAREDDVANRVTTINRISAVLLTISAIFGFLAGWCISAFAGYPLRKLQTYMKKLARLDLEGLPGLNPGSVTQLSSLREVPGQDVNNF